MRAAKQKLVVIGNGMAGARCVEEILARGGGDLFEIAMFGEEPHGNYNRILLSDVLNGSHDEAGAHSSRALLRIRSDMVASSFLLRWVRAQSAGESVRTTWLLWLRHRQAAR